MNKINYQLELDREIDEIKKLGEENNIVVFPGVELSCDTSKIHILVLFDIDCDGNTVQEFLNQLKIFKSNLGTVDIQQTEIFFMHVKLLNQWAH